MRPMTQNYERPPLTYEAFLDMAESLGFNRADSHLEKLFPEVGALLARVNEIRGADLSGIEPSTIYRVNDV